MNAFNSFKQRHAKKSNTDNKNDNHQRSKRIKTNNLLSSHHSQKVVSNNVISNEVPCTPLTDDFENFMLSTEKKTKQRRKKFEFRSRKNKNKIVSIDSLSPIPDIETSDMSLSCSFNGPPITPNDHNTNYQNNNNNNNNEVNTSMDISGISDISSIGNMSPELPPSTPLSLIDTNNLLKNKPKRYSPHSTLKSKPAKRYNDKRGNNVDQITERMDSISIEEQQGSTVRMELISLSPSKSNKYSTNMVLSPVRRSKRIEKLNDESKELKQLLKESNFTFKPNPEIHCYKI